MTRSTRFLRPSPLLALVGLVVGPWAATAPAMGPAMGPAIGLGAGSPAVLAAAPADDEIVREFKKYFRKYKDPAARVEAVLALLGAEEPGVVDVLVPVLGDKDVDVARAAAQVLASFETRPPVDRLIARLEKEKKEPVRVGLLEAMRAGGYGELGEPVLEALEDKGWAVRRHAVLALAAAGDASVSPSIAPLGEDGEPAVRCAVLDSLAALGADETVTVATAHIADEAWQVRSSAIKALGVVRRTESIPVLIERFDVEEGRLRVDLGDALLNLTAKTYGTRVELWKRFWDSYGDRFQIPTDEELAKLRAAQAEAKKRYSIDNASAFVGIETPSRSLLFVIDVSGSMENLVVEREKFAGGDYPSWSRMDIVKTELARTIEGLEPYVKFGIVSFATDTKRWKKKLVPANVINKSSALDWVKRLEPIGGNSKLDLAEAGLTGAANLEAGKTNTYGALAEALGIDLGKGKAKGGSKEKYLGEVDTVFFLSDGRPTAGKYIEYREILDRIREGNLLRKVVLHTIAIGNFEKGFMRQLAEQNGGVFVDLGK
ncbi:MAG: HEAT repeat domain-containing protein [Planctomycetota bacterium]